MTNPHTLTHIHPLLARTFASTFPACAPSVITHGPGSTVWVAAAPNDSAIMNVMVPALDARLAFRLSVPGAPACREDVIGLPLPPWGMYVAAVGWAWAAEGRTVPGLDAVIMPAEGLREGFVWETGLTFAAVWQDVGGWSLPEGGLLGLMTRLRGFFH